MDFKNKNLIVVSIFGFIATYLLFYVRFTYFAGTDVMRFPADLFAMKPICADLLLSTSSSLEIVKHMKMQVVPWVYSPLFVLIYAPLGLIDTLYLKWLSSITIIVSVVACCIYFPRQYKRSLFNSPVAIIVFITIFFSYGLRFEIERGQWNTQTFLLVLLGLKFKDSRNLYYKLLGYVLFSIGVHLKLWPLIFTICFIDVEEKILKNVRNLFYLGIFNVLLLFVLGRSFLYEYFHGLGHATTNFNVWIANISLSAYFIQIESYFHISHSISLFLIVAFLIIYASSIILGMIRGINGSNILILYQTLLGGLLFPSTSFDYKLSVLGIGTCLLFTCYDNIFISSESLFNITIKNGLKISCNYKSLIHLFSLGIIITSYSSLIYSYYYRVDFGFIWGSATTYIIASSLAVSYLIYYNSTKLMDGLKVKSS